MNMKRSKHKISRGVLKAQFYERQKSNKLEKLENLSESIHGNIIEPFNDCLSVYEKI